MNATLANSEPASVAPDTGAISVLFVDDEANIVSSLKRLFRSEGYRLFGAGGGKEGLEMLSQQPVDLVISDMRMPEMNGAQFLEQVRARWPDTVRILLTGYAEIGATIDAINKGQIYRYISKPWDDTDIKLVVRQALERKQLEAEKRRLEALTQQQNEELQALNASLEQKVQQRTAELQQTHESLKLTHEKLKKSFLTSIQVFSNLMELREGEMAGHSRRVADQARKVALRLGLPETEAQEILVAGLLHDIGKMGLPDQVMRKPFGALTAEERQEVVKHPAKGQAALMALEQLRGAAKLIRSHHERFDGMGFPDGLKGLEIPLGARILAVVNDFDALQIGSLTSKRMNAEEAGSFIKEGRGKRYDPQVVDAFLGVVGVLAPSPEALEQTLNTAQLEPGMVLSRDIISPEGILLLSKDFLLDADLIAQIRNFEAMEGRRLTVHVRPPRR